MQTQPPKYRRIGQEDWEEKRDRRKPERLERERVRAVAFAGNTRWCLRQTQDGSLSAKSACNCFPLSTPTRNFQEISDPIWATARNADEAPPPWPLPSKAPPPYPSDQLPFSSFTPGWSSAHARLPQAPPPHLRHNASRPCEMGERRARARLGEATTPRICSI